MPTNKKEHGTYDKTPRSFLLQTAEIQSDLYQIYSGLTIFPATAQAAAVFGEAR